MALFNTVNTSTIDQLLAAAGVSADAIDQLLEDAGVSADATESEKFLEKLTLWSNAVVTNALTETAGPNMECYGSYYVESSADTLAFVNSIADGTGVTFTALYTGLVRLHNFFHFLYYSS